MDIKFMLLCIATIVNSIAIIITNKTIFSVRICKKKFSRKKTFKRLYDIKEGDSVYLIEEYESLFGLGFLKGKDDIVTETGTRLVVFKVTHIYDDAIALREIQYGFWKEIIPRKPRDYENVTYVESSKKRKYTYIFDRELADAMYFNKNIDCTKF